MWKIFTRLIFCWKTSTDEDIPGDISYEQVDVHNETVVDAIAFVFNTNTKNTKYEICSAEKMAFNPTKYRIVVREVYYSDCDHKWKVFIVLLF